jgi:hypothetical protein
LVNPANASIIDLCCVVCPTNVSWSIWTVVVDAVQSHSRWALPEMGEDVVNKNDKVYPTGVDIDSTPTVVFIVFAIWVVASFDNVAPNVVDSSLFSSSCMAMAIVAFVAATRTDASTFLHARRLASTM